MADFSWVTPRVATGAAIASAADVDELVAAGISLVVDARAELDDALFLAQHRDLLYVWNPTQDDGQPKGPAYWGKTLAFVLPALAQPHEKAYLHCAAGINRGPSNAYAVLRALGFAPDYALGLIHTARPVTVNGVRYRDDVDACLAQMGYA